MRQIQKKTIDKRKKMQKCKHKKRQESRNTKDATQGGTTTGRGADTNRHTERATLPQNSITRGTSGAQEQHNISREESMEFFTLTRQAML